MAFLASFPSKDISVILEKYLYEYSECVFYYLYISLELILFKKQREKNPLIEDKVRRNQKIH